MKNTLTLLLALTLAISVAPAADDAISVAKINFSEIEDLLQTVVLARPEHEQLRTRFEAGEAKSDAAQMKMQEAIMKGEKIGPMAAASNILSQSADRKQVETLCEKHLIELLEKLFNEKYDLVLKESYRSSLLYTRVAIDDVTNLVKQELLKQLPK